MAPSPTREELAASYARSLAMQLPDQVASLATLQFAGAFENAKPWAIGPFQRDEQLTFRRPAEWQDPTGIGWRSGALFNPSLIPDGPLLHLFYRASPRMETLDSRIGHAVYDSRTGEWQDNPSNPIVYPTHENETWGCEDPKVFRGPDGFYLAYNGAWEVTPDQRRDYGADLFSSDVGCDIKMMYSPDLREWTKLGQVVPHDISMLWAKAAVVPRDGTGRAVPFDGKYHMYLSEGCGGKLTVGRSADLRSWKFEPVDYLDISALGRLHEVSTALVLPGGREFILDFFYEDEAGEYQAGQALYEVSDPIHPLAISPAGILAWGGVIEWEGSWLFAQGWDAPVGVPEIYFYRAEL